MRYFRALNADVYEAIRADLDAAYGYPSADAKTLTSITPAANAASDSTGRVYLLASDAECDYPAISERLPGLLASGMIEEVGAAEWSALFSQPV